MYVFLLCVMLCSVVVPVNALPDWADDDYLYRVPITISNGYGAGSNYQVAIPVKLNDDVYTPHYERYYNNPFDLPNDDVGYGATHPCAIYFSSVEDGYKYWMFYEEGGSYENETDVEVYLVRSNDGVTWVDTGVSNPVLQVLGVGLHDPHVIRVGSSWFMWYGARQHDPDDFTIGFATSTDGKSWSNVDDCVIGSNASWSARGVFSPSVVYRAGTFHMVYNGLNSTWATYGMPQLGYCYSTDGEHWTEYALNPVMSPSQDWEANGIWHCNIVEYEDRYLLYYSGYPAPDPSEGFGVAESSNFISWSKNELNPFLYSTSEWENARLYVPCPLRSAEDQTMVFIDGVQYMYYSANTDIGSVVHKIGLLRDWKLNSYSFNDLVLSSFNDVTFYSGSTELDFYQEKHTFNEFSTFWVEVPDNLNTSDVTIYMYFGNGSASDQSNGSNTFVYFDDFIGSNLGGDWIDQGTINMSPDGDSFDTWVQLEEDDSIYSTTTFGYGYAVKVNATANEQDSFFVQFKDGHGALPSNSIDIFSSDSIADGDFDQFELRVMNDYPPDYDINDCDNFDTFNEPVWHTYEICRNMSNNVVYGYQDDNFIGYETSNIPIPALGVGFQVEDSTIASTLTVDWIFVRKYVYPEPSVSMGSVNVPQPWWSSRVTLFLGLGGFGMMISALPLMVYYSRHRNPFKGIFTALTLILLGIGLVVGWIF